MAKPNAASKNARLAARSRASSSMKLGLAMFVPLVDSLLPTPPNDRRVRGAGPTRKAVLRLKTCQAPHPLQ
jgi:hypothetical protein